MSNTPSKAEIEALVKRHGATSYRNRADTQHPAYGFTEDGLNGLIGEVLAKWGTPQPAPAPLSEREAFERDWEKRHAPVPTNVRTHDDGRYGDSSIQDAWESWQARAALSAQGGK